MELMAVSNRGSLRGQEKGGLVQVEDGDEHTWEGFSGEALGGHFAEMRNG